MGDSFHIHLLQRYVPLYRKTLQCKEQIDIFSFYCKLEINHDERLFLWVYFIHDLMLNNFELGNLL